MAKTRKDEPKMSKEEKFLYKALDKQFQIAGYNKDEASVRLMKNNGDWDQSNGLELWCTRYKMTVEQNNQMQKWFLGEYAKTFRVNKIKGKRSAYSAWSMWFNFSYGLAILDPENLDLIYDPRPKPKS